MWHEHYYSALAYMTSQPIKDNIRAKQVTTVFCVFVYVECVILEK